MSAWLRRLVAVGVLGVLWGATALPFANELGPRQMACHCPVPMACCQSGACHSDEPASGEPVWKSCSDAPDDETVLPPSPEGPLPLASRIGLPAATELRGTPVELLPAIPRNAPLPPPPEPLAAVQVRS